MGWLSELFQPRATYAPWDDFWYKAPSGLGTSMTGYPVSEDAAMHVSAFFNGIRILAETKAQVPLILYERINDDQKEIARNQPLYNILHNRPNAYQTAYEHKLLQTTSQLLAGNSYDEILGDNRVEELRPLLSGRMRAKLLASGRLGYLYNTDGVDRAFTQDEIHHIRGFPLSPDGVTGTSILGFARETLGSMLAAEAYGSRLYKGDAKRLGNYSVPGMLQPPQREELKKLLRQEDNLILEAGATWVDRGMTPQDIEFMVTRKFGILEMARFLNIQPHLLKDLERATFSNIEHQSLEFLQFTMIPYFINDEQAILRDLIIQKNRFFAEFLVDGVVRADIKTRYEAYATAINTGFMTRNQARAKENWNRIEGLDAPLVDQNKALVDKNGKIMPINKPEGNGNAPVIRPEEDAHYRQLIEGNAGQVMRKEAKALARAWDKDKKDPDKLQQWADKFFAEHVYFVADVMKLDEEKARKFVNDRRDKFVLSVKDKSPHEHIHETEKYGPGQLVAFLQNGKHEEERVAA